jgi:hypothetical protein
MMLVPLCLCYLRPLFDYCKVGCCRYLISQHPDVEQKILAELDALELTITSERPQPRNLTYADLNKLPYLQAVIKVTRHPQNKSDDNISQGMEILPRSCSCAA